MKSSACLAWAIHLAGAVALAGALPEFEERLGAVSGLEQRTARAECLSLLETLPGGGTAATAMPLHDARRLDRLSDTCFHALPWRDPVNQAIGERRVGQWRRLGSEQPQRLVDALLRLGLVYHYATRTHQALEIYLEAEHVAQRWLGRGTDGESLGQVLEMLSTAHLDLGDLDEAADAARRSEQVRRALDPPQPERVVRALNARARVAERRDLSATRALLRQAYDLAVELGDEHLATRAWMASNLGWIEHDLGLLHAARTHLEEAERLRAGLPTERRQLASTRHILAKVLFELGHIPEALATYERAAEGLHEWLGDDPYRYAAAITDLAVANAEAGNRREALRYHLLALELRENAATEPAADLALQRLLAHSLTKAAALAAELGEPWAEAALERALDLLGGVGPSPASPDRAEALIELARLRADAGDVALASALLASGRRELEVAGVRGPRAFDLARLEARLAANPSLALEVLDGALREAEALFGADFPGLLPLRFDRAQALGRRGDHSTALAEALDGHRLSIHYARSVVAAFQRDMALAFIHEHRRGLDLAVQALADLSQPARALIAEVWSAVMAGRQLVFELEAERRRLARASRDPAVSQMAAELLASRNRMAYFLVRSETGVASRGRFEKARAEWLAAERRFAELTHRHVGSASAGASSLSDLLGHLPAGAALVSIHRSATKGSGRYIAFVAADRRLWVVDLGPAARLDELIASWREAQAYGGAGTAARLEKKWRGLALRRILWDPIAARLERPRTVFLVPDGRVHLVPLSALPNGRDRFLVEAGWIFAVLETEKDLDVTPRSPGPGRLLLVGGVDYDHSRSAAALVDAPEDPDFDDGTATRGQRFDHPLARHLGGGRECASGLPGRFTPLPGSLREVDDLATLWRSSAPADLPRPTRLGGADADETALRRQIGVHRLVHLATHGFAASRDCATPRLRMRGAAAREAFGGLVMAGANRRSLAKDGATDGILTELEVLSLDLRNVEWLVLSVCDSGLGDIHPGEGIIGLRRSFRLAGAQTLVLSLWPVEDELTRHFMLDLYRGRWVQRLSSLEAWHQATLEALRRSRARGDGEPYSWAGFIMTGNWR